MRPTWGIGVVFGTSHITIQMVYSIFKQNQSGKYFRYSGIFPEKNKMPGISNQESATNAVLYLIDVISNPATIAPFVYIGSRKLQSIRNLAGILKQTTY